MRNEGETPSVPLFRGKIGMREEGYKFQGSGQLMVNGSGFMVNVCWLAR